MKSAEEHLKEIVMDDIRHSAKVSKRQHARVLEILALRKMFDFRHPLQLIITHVSFLQELKSAFMGQMEVKLSQMMDDVVSSMEQTDLLLASKSVLSSSARMRDKRYAATTLIFSRVCVSLLRFYLDH